MRHSAGSYLQALFLRDLMDMFKSKGWQLIDAEDAFIDPVFAAKPNIVPVGESIIWAVAKETGKFHKALRLISRKQRNLRMKCVKLLALLLLSSGPIAVVRAQDLSSFFKNTEGAFVLYDLKQDRYIRYNEARCRQRFSPKSTFKIPNSLIGLETGVISDANFLISWDRQKYPPQDNWNQEPFHHWSQDQTLRSAIKYSVVWYYKELAKRVGEERMQKYVAAFNYGNKTISGGIDNFWLNNSLKISADEQIDFLKAFYTRKLPVSKRSIDIVKSILVLEEAPAYKLSGKTGGGPIADATYIGWFVGYLETKGDVYFFALNLEGPDFPSIRDRRVLITKQILSELGYLPRTLYIPEH